MLDDFDEETSEETRYGGDERVPIERRGVKLWMRDSNINLEVRKRMGLDLGPGLERWGWGWNGKASEIVLGVRWEDIYWSYACFCTGALAGGCIGENMLKIGLRCWGLLEWIENMMNMKPDVVKSTRFCLSSLLAWFVFRATRAW